MFSQQTSRVVTCSIGVHSPGAPNALRIVRAKGPAFSRPQHKRTNRVGNRCSPVTCCRAKNKEARNDPAAKADSEDSEPIKEGPFGLKSSKGVHEEGPVDDQQVEHPAQQGKTGEILGAENASKLDRALEKAEHQFVSTSDCALKDMVGQYEFKDEEKGVFRFLVSVMRRLAMSNFALAAASIALTASKAARHRAEHIPFVVMRGFGISSVAYILDALVSGALVWMAAVSFKQANASEADQQLPHTFQGIMQIGVMFTQITTTSVCLAIVQTLEAAVRWPDIVLVAAVACAVVAVVRTAAMGLVLAKYTPGSGKGTMALMGMRKGEGHIPWIDKLALTIVGGLLLPFSMPMTNPLKGMGEGESKDEQQDDKERKEVAKENGKKEEPEEDAGEECAAYEFSVTETTILEVVMDSMRTCGLAIGLLALSSLMLGSAVVFKGGITDIHTYIFQILEHTIRASLLFTAAGCFHDVVSSNGRDMKHLLMGLGKERGMGLLFFRMQKVAFSAAMFKAIDTVVPFITRTALFKNLYHKVLNALMAVLPNAISNLIAAHV